MSINAQKAIVNGKIIDNKDKAVDFVSIAVLGTSIGEISDGQGNYSIKVPADTQVVLVFSTLGYVKQMDSRIMKFIKTILYCRQVLKT